MNTDLDQLWSTLAPNASGLVAAVIQHAHTGQVLMVGYMNYEALGASLTRRRVTMWSRSRNKLWEKGETSGNTLELRGLRADCDGDALLIQAIPKGPTCHTGTRSCFYRLVVDDGVETPAIPEDDGPPASPASVLEQVGDVIAKRKAGLGMTQSEGKSYVRSLLTGGAPKIGAKVREEADELAVALEEESDERVANEAADLLFHALVGLAHRDLDLKAVAQILAARFGVSGLDEKASR